MAGFGDVVHLAQLGQLGVFVVLAAASLRHWRRRRGVAAAWLAATLAVLAVDAALATVTGANPVADPGRWASRLIVAVVVLFPACLFHLAAAVRDRERPPRLVAVLTAVAVAASLALPGFPGPDRGRPVLYDVYALFVAGLWTWLSCVAIARLWTGGRHQPPVVARRMQLLGLGAVALNLAVLAAAVASHTESATQLPAELFGLAAGLLFYLGFAPPAALRAAWRRPDLDAVQDAGAELITAASEDDVRGVILAHATRLMGGRAALLVNDHGVAVAAHGVEGAEAAALARAVNRGRGATVGLLTVPMADGWLAVLGTNATPLFGADELSLLSALARLAHLALERVRMFGREVASRHALQEREEQLAQAQHLARMASWRWNLVDGSVEWSDELRDIFGLSDHEDPGDFEWFLGRVHDDDQQAVRNQIDRAVAERSGFMSEYRIVVPDNRVRWLLSRGEVVLDEAGAVVGMRGVCQEITAHRRTRDELLTRSRQQAAVARLGQHALVEADLGVLMQEACVLVAEVLGVDHARVFELVDTRRMLLRAGVGWRDGLVGQHSVDVAFGGHAASTLVAGRPVTIDDVANDPRTADDSLLREHGVVSGVSVVIPGKTGALGVLGADSVRARVFTPTEIEFLQAVANVLGTVIERRRADDELAHQALHDPLTGLPNRALLIDRLALAIARASRRGTTVAVLFLDVDRFKLVNDGLGHGAGDELLKTVAARLTAVVRPTDTVARFGGDEFVVVCEEATDEKAVTGLAQRMCDAVSGHLSLDGRQMQVTVSIGIVLAGAERADPEAILRDADAAMYRAKERGRARYELFDDSLRERVLERLETEAWLRQALERDELRLVFQPEVSLTDGRVVGVEALIRWEHPQRGLLGPGAFLPLAEETGLIVPMGMWTLEQACRHAQTWRGHLRDAPPFVVWVNLSARQLSEPGLVEQVASILADTGADPTMVGIEITESVLMEDIDAVGSVVHSLKRLGVRLAIDDFGTGFSSLSYLKQFPVDVLKVDKSFVDGLGSDDGDSAIVRAVIELAHSLGLAAVAEGVETAGQMAALRRLGCDTAQGYYFDRPGAPSAIANLLETGAHPAYAGRRVLVCDDDPDTRLLYRLALEHEGVKVDEAVNGAECLEMAERLAPDVVVLDVFLPDIDGLTTLPELQRLLPSARVLIVSALNSPDLRERGLELGADGCFDKVDFVPRLPQLVRRYLTAA